MDETNQSVGKRIMKLRKEKGYTRERFAEVADITPKFLYDIEMKDRGFSADTLLRIAEGLEVNCHYILTGCNDFNNIDEMSILFDMMNKAKLERVKELLNSIYHLMVE